MTQEIVDDYGRFIQNKALAQIATGFDPQKLAPHLFDFQAAIVGWACKRGRAAIFADTGLGKTAMQTEWARQVAGHTGGRVLILAALRKDAERYRKLRDSPISDVRIIGIGKRSGVALDDAADAIPPVFGAA